MIETDLLNVPATVGEYAGFKMAVSFDSINHKFVMNLKGQLSHNLEIGTDPLGNIARINHALESMTKEFADARVKLENVEHQIETAKTEVTKPFAQEAELAEKLDRLAALNALLNMDESGNDAVSMEDDAPEQTEEADTLGHDDQKTGQAVADKSAQRVSLKEKLEAYKAQVAGTGKINIEKSKGKEETL